MSLETYLPLDKVLLGADEEPASRNDMGLTGGETDWAAVNEDDDAFVDLEMEFGGQGWSRIMERWR